MTHRLHAALVVAAALCALTHPSLAAAQTPAPTPGPNYKIEVMAKTGQAGLLHIGDSPSINDAGSVAMTGRIAGGQGGFVADLPASPVNINPLWAAPGIHFGDAADINGQRKVLVRELKADPPQRTIETWDPATPNGIEVLASGGDDFRDVLSHGS